MDILKGRDFWGVFVTVSVDMAILYMEHCHLAFWLFCPEVESSNNVKEMFCLNIM